MSADEDRARALALLESAHEFPGDYRVTIIVKNEPAVLITVRSAVEAGLVQPLAESACETVPSRGGKYLSLRFVVPCPDATAVLDLYARVKGLPGVVQVL